MNLRIHVAEKWEVTDYIEAFSAVETIYYVTLANINRWDELFPAPQRRFSKNIYRESDLSSLANLIVSDAREFADYEDRLLVNKISHASPGFIDFNGLGEVADAMERAFGRIIDVIVNRKLRQEMERRASIETDIIKENLNSLKLDNARKLLQLGQDYPEIAKEHDLLRILIAEQGRIENLAAKGLITPPRDHKDDA